MIITKVPLRISFAGGGTDLPAFYSKEDGQVFSTSINKYVYIAVHKYFENKILLKYSRTELVDDINDIENEIFRECLRFLNIRKGIEITSIADLPTKTGLGSSSTFTVALLQALHAFKGEQVSAEKLAQEAAHIEIDILGAPIGKQDQYASSYGGLNTITFRPDESVKVERFLIRPITLRKLDRNLMLFYTNITRAAKDILSEQKQKTDDKRETLRKMKGFIDPMKGALSKGDLDGFGRLLNDSWMEKKKVVGKISNSQIDEYYDRAIKAGALGGKLLGAGGGGHLLFYCDIKNQDKVRKALSELREVRFHFERDGARLIHFN